MKTINSCAYNIDTGTVQVEYADGTKLDILCNRIEEMLELSPVMEMKFDWLIYNEPYTFAELALSGELMPYLEWYEKDFRQQEENIRAQLERRYDTETAREIATEFMMYES